MKITTDHLEFLDFERTDEFGFGGVPFFYYTKNLSSDICLISCASDEREDGIWKLYLFDSDNYEIINFEDLTALIAIFNKITKK